MGKLRNLFLEEVNEPEQEMFYDEPCMTEVNIDVNTDNVTQENLITDIYNQNELSDLSKSIFKVEELINSLPKEMPNETKRATVLSILSSFGLTVDEVVDDGENRKAIIASALTSIIDENTNVINDNNVDIEQKKLEIQNLEKDNSDRSNVIKDTEDKIELETKRIEELIKFIGGNV